MVFLRLSVGFGAKARFIPKVETFLDFIVVFLRLSAGSWLPALGSLLAFPLAYLLVFPLAFRSEPLLAFLLAFVLAFL